MSVGGLDPRARQRVQTVSVRPTIKPGVSNTELFEMWRDAMPGKIAKSTIKTYSSAILEAIRCIRTDEGRELPVSRWTKPDVWKWVHFVEGNFCANFQQVAFKLPILAKCRANVWKGSLVASEAAAAHCGDCSLFKRTRANYRLHGVDKWFSFLARVGAVQVNFMPDVIREWYEENPNHDNASVEKKRNPTVEEVVTLVNGTTHPRNRFTYAATAKWWTRPNELFLLDRYASFGLPMPEGCSVPAGFEEGFAKHPEVPTFAEGGELVYIPEKRDANGAPEPDKRKGNRWLVIDAELRPIVGEYLAWWERTVQRLPDGRPAHTRLMIWETGLPVKLARDGCAPLEWNERTFYRDAERLGLMRPEDRTDPRRRWAGHCQRHFGERLRQLLKLHPDWSNHFRGDAFRDARGGYYKPEPLEVRKMYLDLIPLLGFKPLPDTPKRVGVEERGEAFRHRAFLAAEAERVVGLKRGKARVLVATVTSSTGEAWNVPRRWAPSVAFALRLSMPGTGVQIQDEGTTARYVDASELASVAERALALLG